MNIQTTFPFHSSNEGPLAPDTSAKNKDMHPPDDTSNTASQMTKVWRRDGSDSQPALCSNPLVSLPRCETPGPSRTLYITCLILLMRQPQNPAPLCKREAGKHGRLPSINPCQWVSLVSHAHCQMPSESRQLQACSLSSECPNPKSISKTECIPEAIRDVKV
jgi:hypothetical protein